MTNFSSLFKAEITRLARKEVRSEVEPLRRSAASARSEIAALKKTVRTLEQQLKQALKAISKHDVPKDDLPPRKFRFRPTAMKAHREKVGLSAKDYGLLLSASMLSVYKWEDGKAQPRPKALPTIQAVLRLGKREALRKLEELKKRDSQS